MASVNSGFLSDMSPSGETSAEVIKMLTSDKLLGSFGKGRCVTKKRGDHFYKLSVGQQEVLTLTTIKELKGSIVGLPIVYHAELCVLPVGELQLQCSVSVLQLYGNDVFDSRIAGDSTDAEFLHLMLKRIFPAILHLHSLSIAHGDVKPENIVLPGVLIDYEYSTNTSTWSDRHRATNFLDDVQARLNRGSLGYSCPDLLALTHTIDHLRDVFEDTQVLTWVQDTTIGAKLMDADFWSWMSTVLCIWLCTMAPAPETLRQVHLEDVDNCLKAYKAEYFEFMSALLRERQAEQTTSTERTLTNTISSILYAVQHCDGVPHYRRSIQTVVWS